MPNKTLYVGPRQEAVWARAEAEAGRLGVSLSGFVTRAIREYLDAAADIPEGRVIATTREGVDLFEEVTRIGRWVQAHEERIVKLEAPDLPDLRAQVNALARHVGADRVMGGFDD